MLPLKVTGRTILRQGREILRRKGRKEKHFIESQIAQYVMMIDLEERLTIIQQQGRKRQRDGLDSNDREEKRQKK